MKKTNIIRMLLFAIIIVMLVLYGYEIIVQHEPMTKHLFRTLSIICLCIASLIRTRGPGRKSLDYYDSQYSDILRDAFVQQPFWRNKLLCAVRLYNESNYDKALKYLADMKKRSQTGSDHYAVNLFAALCFTDIQLYDHAERLYRQLIEMGLEDSRTFSNMGHVQLKAGNQEKALQSYQRALEYDKNNAFAYNNIAQTYFQMREFTEAKEFAMKALEINPKMHQPATLLATISALEADNENYEKYSHIAVCNGMNPQKLRDTIAYFQSVKINEDNPE